MRTWTYVVERRAVEQIMQFPEEDWSAVLAQFESLANAPFQPCHLELPSVNGRRVSLKRMGLFVITYWDDFAVREIRIASIGRR